MDKYKENTQTFIETFLSWDDAIRFIEGHLIDFSKEPEWYVEQQSVVKMNGAFRAGFVVTKKQGELFE